MAVSLGYKNVYRYPEGYPEWLQRGRPVSEVNFLSEQIAHAEKPVVPVPKGLYLGLALAAVFLGGVALNLTPCIYPLIPITVSYFGGRSDSGGGSTVIHGLSYIFGLALINSILGVTAAMSGGLIGSLLQNSFVLITVSAILFLFAFSLFGLWEIKLPVAFNTMASRTYSGYGGSLFMGLTLGVIAAPCIGPFVIGLLSWIAAVGRIWFGFLVFFILSLGMGLPLFVLALFSGKISRLPRSGEWMIWVRKLMAWIMVGMASYFISPLLPEHLVPLLYAAIAVIGGIHLGWLEKSTIVSKGFRRFRTVIGISFIGLGMVLAVVHLTRGQGVSWVQYNETILEQAKADGKPVVLDFSAAWCTPCRKMDDTTFRNTEVVERSQQILMIKIDLTTGATAEYQALIDRFIIKGVPTIIFLDKQGNERVDLRLVDYLGPDKFLLRMSTLQ